MEDLDDVDTKAKKLGSTLRSALKVDPRVRRSAQELRKGMDNYASAVETALDRINRLKAAEETLQNAIVRRDAAVKAGRQNIADSLQNEIDVHQRNVDVIHEEGGGWAGMTKVLKLGAKEFDDASKQIERAGKQVEGFGGKLNTMSARLRQVVPVLRGLGVILITALVPAVVALGGAVAASAVAFVGMAGAVAGAAVPALIVFQGFMSRLSAVMDAVRKKQLADNQAKIDGKGPTGQLAQANEALRQAHQRAADAARGITDAEQALAQAQRDAREEIRNAIAARVEAYQRVKDAAADVEQAEVDGLRAIRDAAEDARDAILDLEEADLRLDEARLNTRESVAELKKLRQESGLTGLEFQSLFDKFTDVDIDFNRNAFRKALATQGISDSSDEAFKLEHAVLRVREAHLQEKSAIDGVKDSQQEANDKQREANKLATQGLKAYEPYTEAVKALAEAQEDAGDAAREAARLQRQGIKGNQGVIQAQRGLADAHRNAADANRALRRQEILTTDARKGLTAQMKAAKEALKKLSPAERGFADLLDSGREAALKFIREGTDPMFESLTRAGEKLAGLQDSFFGKAKLFVLASALRGIGSAFGKVIEDFAAFATSKEGVGIFASAARLARRLILVIGGPLMKNAIKLIGGLVRVFGPGVLSVFRMIAKAIGGVAESVGGIGAKDKKVKSLMSTFRTMLKFVMRLADGIVAFATGASKPGRELVKWISDGVAKFTEWMRSAEGRASIKQFFKEAIPFVKTMIKTVVKLTRTFFEVFEFVAPAMTDLFDGINGVIDVVNFLLGVFNKLPGQIKTILTLMLPIGGQIRGGFLAARVGIGAVRVGLGTLIVVLTALGAVGKKVVNAIVDAFTWLVDKVKAILGIGSPSTVFAQIGKDIIRGLVQGVKSMAQFLFNGAKWLVSRWIRGIKRLAGLVFAIGKWWIQKVVAGVKTMANFLWEGAKWLVNRWIAGVKRNIEIIKKVGSWVIHRLWDGIKGIASWLKDKAVGVGKWIIDGVKTLATDFFELGKDLVKGLANGIKDAAGDAVGAIGDMAGDVKDKFTGFFGIGSPSKLFAGFGRNLVQGVVIGMNQEKPAALRAMDSLWEDLADNPALPGLASGGLVRGPAVRRLGEAGREAVVPLRRAVLRELGAAVVGSMSNFGGFPGGALAAGAGGNGGGIHIDSVVLPPPPQGGVPDARYQAAQLAAELRRRGGR